MAKKTKSSTRKSATTDRPRRSRSKPFERPAQQMENVSEGEEFLATHDRAEGSIEEETLSRNAPFNKTYGIRGDDHDESDAPVRPTKKRISP